MPPRAAVVHIGAGKAGTTTIQAALAESRDSLAAAGYSVFAPSDMRGINRWCLTTILDHHLPSEAHLISSRRIAPVADPDRLVREFHDRVGEADRLLVSNEYMSDIHPVRLEQRLEILGRLLEGIPDITIVYYVRQPDAFFVSLYLQWFLPELPVTMREFMRDFDFTVTGPERLSLDWHAHCLSIRRAFPAARLAVRWFEDAARTGLIQDFWRQCALPNPPPVAVSRANVSLGALPYLAMRGVGRHLPSTARGKAYAALRKINLRTRLDAKLLLSTDHRERIRTYYAEAYRLLGSEFGLVSPG